MANSFDCFFEEYKKLPGRFKSDKKRQDWTILIVLLIALILCVILLLSKSGDILCGCIGLALIICISIISVNIDPYSAEGPDKQPYLIHMAQVIELLKRYGITQNDNEKIKAIIDYANGMIARRDPFVDIKKAMLFTGSATAVAVSFLSGALDGTINILDSIPYLIVIAVIIFLLVMCFAPLSDFLYRLFSPNKAKYQRLIDDLSHILMFDIDKLAVDIPTQESVTVENSSGAGVHND